MKKIITLTISILFSSALFAFDKDFELLFPESPSIYAYVKDFTAIDQLDEDHPLSEFLKDDLIKNNLPQIFLGQLYQPSDSDDNEDKQFDLFLEFMEKHCNGRIAFAVEELMQTTQLKAESQKATEKRVDVETNIKASFVMDSKSDIKKIKDDLIRMMKMKKSSKWKEDTFENTTFYKIIHKKQPTYLCAIDNLLTLTSDEDVLIDLITRIKKPNKSNTLLDNQKYMDSISTYKETDAFLYFNLEELYDQFIADPDTSLLNKIEENPMAKNMVSTDAIKNDLHLDALSSVFMTAKIIDEGLDYKVGFTVKSHEGIAKLFSYDEKAPEIPDFVNEAYKALAVSGYDFAESFSELEQMFNKVSPGAFMMMKMQLGTIYEELKTGFINNLEPYAVELMGHADNNYPIKDIPSNATVLKVKDTQQAADLLDKLMAKANFKIKEEDFLDEKIYQVNLMGLIPMMAMQHTFQQTNRITYISLVDHYLLIADAVEEDFFRNLIAQIKKPGKNIKSHDQLMDMWGYLPDGEVAMGYADVAQILLNIYYARKNQELLQAKLKGEEVNIDEKKDPPPNVKSFHYSIITKTYHEKYLWYTHSLLFKYDPLEN